MLLHDLCHPFVFTGSFLDFALIYSSPFFGLSFAQVYVNRFTPKSKEAKELAKEVKKTGGDKSETQKAFK